MERAERPVIRDRERDRLFDAALLELGRRGRDQLTSADVLATAGISQAEFDAEFEDLDSCLFAAFDQLTERLARAARAGRGVDAEWTQRARVGLGTLLEQLATHPDMARMLTEAFPAIGPLAQMRYTEFLETFTPLLRGARALSPVEGEPPGELEMLAIGAAEAIICEEIQAGRTAQLPAMAPTILVALLAPFLGNERALALTEGDPRPGASGPAASPVNLPS